jgi:hypothetical protein
MYLTKVIEQRSKQIQSK